MIRHSVVVMGKRTAYWERNPGNLCPIVILHGFRGTHNGLVDLARHLDGYRLILPDLPGYGESEPLDSKHTLTNYAAWLDEFVATVGLADFVVWGHSCGGSTALIHGAVGSHKAAAIIGVSPAAVRRGPSAWIATSYYQLGCLMPERLRKRWLTSRVIDHAIARLLFQTVSDARRKALVRRGDIDLATFDPRVITEQYMSSRDTDLVVYASAIKIPVLIIAGARDIVVPIARVRDLMDMIPHGRLEIMPDQGHLAPIERPAATATIIRQFMSTLPLHQ